MTVDDFLNLAHARYTVIAVFAIALGVGWCIAEAVGGLDVE